MGRTISRAALVAAVAALVAAASTAAAETAAGAPASVPKIGMDIERSRLDSLKKIRDELAVLDESLDADVARRTVTDLQAKGLEGDKYHRQSRAAAFAQVLHEIDVLAGTADMAEGAVAKREAERRGSPVRVPVNPVPETPAQKAAREKAEKAAREKADRDLDE